MSETTTAPEAVEDAAGTEQQPEAKTFDADYVEKLRKEAARYRTEAKANADAAKKLADIEEAQKTAEQKAAERLAEAERKAAEAEAKMALATVAGESGVPADILNGPEDRTTEGLQAFADKITAYVGAATAPRTPKPDPNQGRQSHAPTTTADLFAASMAGRI